MPHARHPAAALFCWLALTSAIAAQEETGPPDLMSFAQGVLPVTATSDGTDMRIGMEQAIAAIDGNPLSRVVTVRPAQEGDAVEFTYALPAPTRFDGFAVPNVTETPSPSQTFFRSVLVLGSATGPDGPYSPLAGGTLATHAEKGQMTALTTVADAPAVGWVRLRLQGGIDVQRDKTYLEFSELIGTGTQDDPPLSERFTGTWAGRGVKLELQQSGATVIGCYDGTSRLEGTVSGNVLRALGQDPAGVPAQFILIATDTGAMRGLRSSNGAPFKSYDGEPSGKSPTCLAPEPPKLGCGSVIHGIGFDYDSDAIRASARPLIADLHAGLAGESASIRIVGHSSAEGAADYNRDLSERRARSVVAALVALGLDPARISAAGRGEDEPIASNDDEAGRSMNRRVEVVCTG